MNDLHRVQEAVSGLLTEVAMHFKGQPRITLLVRHPELAAAGKDADFVLTDDTLHEAIAALQRRASMSTPVAVGGEGLREAIDKERTAWCIFVDKQSDEHRRYLNGYKAETDAELAAVFHHARSEHGLDD